MANEGNKWWERRCKHGRGMLFSSPHLMWEAACEYFKAEDEATYLQRRDVVGTYQGTVIADTVTCKVPYTWEGLCLYMHCSTGYFRNFRAKLRKELAEGINVEVNEDFKTVVETIEDTIRKQQMDGAHAGQLKEGLVTRYLKIADKTEISTPEDQSFNVTLKLD
jgi:hypothetical protein